MLGEFSNVDLSFVEHQKLRSRFGEAATVEYIEKLSCWFELNPRKKKGRHYARLLVWMRKDLTVKVHTPEPLPLIEEAEYRHRAEIMQQIREREHLPYLTVEELVERLKGQS